MFSLLRLHRLSQNLRSPVTHLLFSWGSRISSTARVTVRQVSSADHKPLPTVDTKPFSAIPGPKPLPVLRNLFEFKKNYFKLHEYLEHCSDKYGEIFKLEAPGRNNFVYISDPNALESIFRVEGKYPRKETTLSPRINWIMNKLDFAVPLFFKIGEEWKNSRSALKNQTKPSNVQTYTAGLSDIVGSFIDYVQSTRDREGRVSDINRPLKNLMVATTAKFVFNADLHIFDNPTKETDEFIKALQLISDSLIKLLVEPPWYKLYPNKVYRDFKKGFTVTNQYSMKYANEVSRSIEFGEKEAIQGMLQQWLMEGKMTEKEALMAATSMFAAGVDTTSSQAAMMLHIVAKNPNVQERLYNEIKSVLGERTQPTPEDLTKMTYLKGCMMESLRLQPSGPFIARVLENDINLMGYSIPSETSIAYLNSVAGKKETIYSNPEIFDPERWARDKPNPFGLLLFGYGPRSCYGKRFAELELKLLLCQTIQKYSLRTDIENLDLRLSTLLKPVGDLPIYFEERQ